MKIVRFLFSPLLMGALFIVFAISMGFATFIENDYGASAARAAVYNSWWFEAVIILLAVNMCGQIINYKLYKRGKLTVFLFHAAFVVMILGAGITRYFSVEGIMHIREGETKNYFVTDGKYLSFKVSDEANATIDSHDQPYNITSLSVDNFKATLKDGDVAHTVELKEFIPNASETITDNPNGEPMGSFLVTTEMGMREVVFLSAGETAHLPGFSLNFGDQIGDFTVSVEGSKFFLQSLHQISRLNMMTQEVLVFDGGEKVALEQMGMYTVNNYRIVPQKLTLRGVVKPIAVNQSTFKTGQNALLFEYTNGSETRTMYVFDNNSEDGSEATITNNGKAVTLSFGAKKVELPFSIKLNDFIIDRYPGSNSPSGYKSAVTLIDKEQGIEQPSQIYMNNILKHRGFRFYQSSYDQDEMGTVLSVNMDLAGMLVTYAGYGIMILFILLSIFNPKSLFRTVTGSYWTSPLSKAAIMLILLLGITSLQPAKGQKLVVDPTVADKFGTVLVQDQKGRTEPMFTLTSDILRKVSRSADFEGLSPMQVYLGLYFDFQSWSAVRMIKVSNSDVQKMLGIRSAYASFNDIVVAPAQGGYKLERYVNEAYGKDPAARTKFDKEIIKLDERVNIVYMISTGEFMNIFPMGDGSDKWGNSETALAHVRDSQDSTFVSSVLPLYRDAIYSGARSGNFGFANQYTEAIKTYQNRFSSYELSSEGKIKAEVFYSKAGIFERLFPFYALLGIALFIALVWSVVKGGEERSIITKVLSWIIFSGVVVHTLGLALRWYISGHSPMSNGYESMIFISWVTLVAGIIFSRRSPFALSATAILGAMTLMVAHLSFMDPEITNLVPVLQSYWLTLHVSVITGSYGFLGLGAILGLVVMILISLSGKSNTKRIEATITELTVINFKSLTLGLYLLTIGTFLGAIWANESWGRYWGWDPKETWSLITMIVYSLVIHLRMIPGMKGIFTYNVLALAAFSSVLMTYFGVNYYLSGLHSYAGGDPVPVPTFVYVAVVLLVGISVVAWMKYKKWMPANKK